jgi:hypothetical protein
MNVLSDPLKVVSRFTYITFPILQAMGSWIVDLVLLLRVFVVFPFRSTRPCLFVSIFAFPATVKIARLVLIVTSILSWGRSVKDLVITTPGASANVNLVGSPLQTSELVCALADHMCVSHDNSTRARDTSNPSSLSSISMCTTSSYISAIFLWKLRNGLSNAADSGRVTNGGSGKLIYVSMCPCLRVSHNSFVDSIAGRIRTLFYIALGNFIFPSKSQRTS